VTERELHAEILRNVGNNHIRTIHVKAVGDLWNERRNEVGSQGEIDSHADSLAAADGFEFVRAYPETCWFTNEARVTGYMRVYVKPADHEIHG
jgi:hypothetical protein